jgi:16S rRNA C967 or C1407 C5-methylase (RsmB/RsmF family)
MVDKILNLLDDAKNNIKNQEENISASAKNQYEKMVEDWIKIIPQIEESGLQLYSFSFSASLNPSIDAELRGKCVDFPLEKWEELISLNEKNKSLSLVYNTLKSTFKMYHKIKPEMPEDFYLRLRIKLSPEIRVYIGEPPIAQ